MLSRSPSCGQEPPVKPLNANRSVPIVGLVGTFLPCIDCIERGVSTLASRSELRELQALSSNLDRVISRVRLSILKTFKKAPSLVLTSTRTRACGNRCFASVPTLRILPCLSTKIEIRRGRECTHPQFVQYLIRSVPAFGRFALFSSSMVA